MKNNKKIYDGRELAVNQMQVACLLHVGSSKRNPLVEKSVSDACIQESHSRNSELVSSSVAC